MQRTEITAEVVAKADLLATFGIDPATIAARLGITEYVAGLLVRNVSLPPRLGQPQPSSRRAPNSQRGLEATTIRRIQRMLEVGWLNHQEIAREAGVSANIVAHVASGKRTALTLARPRLSRGEQFLPEPIRCRGCHALLSVVPCRVCRLHLAALADELLSSLPLGFSKIDFPCWNLVGLLSEYLNQTFGGTIMQDLLSILSAEVSAFLAAQDKREYLIARAEKFFDEVVQPIDLPGPDVVVDPVLRAVIRPLVGRVYDELIKKLEIQTNAA